MASRCTKLVLQSAVRSSSTALTGASSSSSSSRAVQQSARTLASSSRSSAAPDASSQQSSSPLAARLRQRLAMQSGSSSSPSPSGSSSSLPARPEPGSRDPRTDLTNSNPDDFEVPYCLQATETHPPTHGIHVATLHLRSYSDSLQNLDLFCDFARKAAYAIGIPISNVVHLPTRTSLWTVPRSPFVHKKSQENFWRKTHSRALKLWDANDEVVDRWLHFLRIHALPGVGMKAELIRFHELDAGSKFAEEAQALLRMPMAEEGPVGADGATSPLGGAVPGAQAQTAEASAEEVKRIADEIVAKDEREQAEQGHQSEAAAEAKTESANETGAAEQRDQSQKQA